MNHSKKFRVFKRNCYLCL